MFVDWSVKRRGSERRRRAKLLQFEAMWLQEEMCAGVVENNWCGSSTTNNLSRNIANCGQALSSWSDKTFGDVPKALTKCRKELDELQAYVQTLEVVQ